jgi:hypothetical protein
MRYLLALFILASAASAEILEEPQDGHGSLRAGFETGYQETLGTSLGLNFRYGLHDILDRQTGYPAYTQLDLLHLRSQIFPTVGKFFIDELVLARWLRVPPLSKSWRELSWKLEAGGRTVRDATCSRCGVGNLLAGLGVTVEPFEKSWIAFWVLAEAEILGSPALPRFLEPSVGPRFGARFRLAPWCNGMVYGLYRFQPLANRNLFESGTQWRFSVARNWALDIKLARYGEGWEGVAGVLAYY